MQATEVLPIVGVLGLVTVEFGGWALLGFATGGPSPGGGATPEDATRRMRFFRAGHAHAGVLIVLSLVYYLYLDRADGAPERPTVGTTVTRTGAGLIAVALVVLAIGLIKQL